MKIIYIHMKMNDDLGRDYHCTGYVLQRLSPFFFCTADFKIYFSRKYKMKEHDTKGPQSAGRSLSLVSGSSNSSPLSLLFKLPQIPMKDQSWQRDLILLILFRLVGIVPLSVPFMISVYIWRYRTLLRILCHRLDNM
jgi:hypothetical protein